MPILGGCLCFDLPTGSKIIGGIYLFSALVNTLFLALLNLMLWSLDMVPQFLQLIESLMTQIQTQADNMDHQHGDVDSSDYPNEDHSGHYLVMDNSTRQQQEQIKETLAMIRNHIFGMKVGILILLCLAFLSIISSSMLIHGIRKNRRGLLVLWILQEVVHIVVGLFIVVIVFMLFGAANVSWIVVIPVVFAIFFQVFFIIVVVSQFQALGLIRMHDEMCMK